METCRSLTVNQQIINLANYCGGEKILSPPRFQHCGGKRPRCPRGSDAYDKYPYTPVATPLFDAVYFVLSLYYFAGA